MDALLLINVTAPVSEPVSALLAKAVIAGGVVIEAFTGTGADVGEGVGESAGESVTDDGFDTLVIHSGTPDIFDGVEELAPVADSLGVDRFVICGDNGTGQGDGAIAQSAIAATVLDFDAVIAVDAVTANGEPVDAGAAWLKDAQAAGVQVSAHDAIWLRM